MIEQIDADTWRGSASGYHRDLYYHIRKHDTPELYGIEWHCGFEYGKYSQVYPVLLFPPDYIEPGSQEPGVYLHWVSFLDPGRVTPMIMQGIQYVHSSECRVLKGILERNAGHTAAVAGRHVVRTTTIYIDAPAADVARYAADLRNVSGWTHLVRPRGEVGPDAGDFVDEYDQSVQLRSRARERGDYHLIDHDAYYPAFELHQRSPMLIIPCAHAFGVPEARGCILQRISFWRADQPARHGRLVIEDFGAEGMAIKRRCEAQAGNLESFGRGMSYQPDSAGTTREQAR
jgi:hypothetical protein